MFIRDIEVYVRREDSIYYDPVFDDRFVSACYGMCEQDKYGRLSENGAETYFLFLFGA